MSVFHPLSIEEDDLPQNGFTNPFRYVPCKAVRKAAEDVVSRISKDEKLAEVFAEGKMLGVLIVKDLQGEPGYLCGFSGNVGGESLVEGFVPPVYDLLAPEGHYKEGEKAISQIGEEIASIQEGRELADIRTELSFCQAKSREEIDSMKAEMSESRKRREIIRQSLSEDGCKDELISQSQHEKASLRRLKRQWEERLSVLKEREKDITDRIAALKARRRSMSDELQQWIFHQYIVHNALGEKASIWEIFQNKGLVPPGGTGECAAPKMLEEAFRNGFTPQAMGEFWYGMSPDTAVRVQGHFYPSCTSKCGPLLGYMLQGLEVQGETPVDESPDILHIDEEIIVAVKPSGMPSVPGLDGRLSLQEWLSEQTGKEVFSVHRLDMDTSGVMVFARNASSQTGLQSQFENRTVKKVYLARLCPGAVNQEGRIELPLSPDYDERPRQKVDFRNGKEAVTLYRVLEKYPDGSTLVEFRPLTGRTHQLRVHAAHPLGLGCPIEGDLLYGGCSLSGASVKRLQLQAKSISFIHPATGEPLLFDI